jgi:RNA polymerase sigma-70 factor (ECF subfamily)
MDADGLFPPETDPSATREVLARIRSGDRSAFDELYHRWRDELLFVARARLGARLRGFLDSEDILQSVALEAFTELPRFVPRHDGSLRKFLHQLVVRKIQDRAETMNARKRAGAVPLTDSVPDSLTIQGEPGYHDRARFERLERGLALLPEEMRQVLVLRKVEGLSGKEAAAALGRSDAATRQLYARALSRLADWFASQPP